MRGGARFLSFFLLALLCRGQQNELFDAARQGDLTKLKAQVNELIVGEMESHLHGAKLAANRLKHCFPNDHCGGKAREDFIMPMSQYFQWAREAAVHAHVDKAEVESRINDIAQSVRDVYWWSITEDLKLAEMYDPGSLGHEVGVRRAREYAEIIGEKRTVDQYISEKGL